ncbi:hypothetical protein ACFQML_22200 [Salinirubellus salinus]|uniref:hypothetical protein n=1 Tax=Salinirubellus salinus TaxID=1364945 RepID=UPI003609D8CA
MSRAVAHRKREALTERGDLGFVIVVKMLCRSLERFVVCRLRRNPPNEPVRNVSILLISLEDTARRTVESAEIRRERRLCDFGKGLSTTDGEGNLVEDLKLLGGGR